MMRAYHKHCLSFGFFNRSTFCEITRSRNLDYKVCSYSYRVSLFNRIVLRGVMQCYSLVGKGEFSASIGTAGDCCAVSLVEVRSRRSVTVSNKR